MITTLCVLAASACVFACQLPRATEDLTPDGMRYLALGNGARLPFPFRLRWLLPTLCRNSMLRWRLVARLHTIVLPTTVSLWLSTWGVDAVRAAIGGLLIVGYPALWRLPMRWPVLIDVPAMVWALGAACLVRLHVWSAALAVSLLVGSMKETAPVFAACFAWSPLPLVGLAVPVLFRCVLHPGPDIFGDRDSLIFSAPLRAGLSAHSDAWRHPTPLLAPWGIGLAGIVSLAGPCPEAVVVSLALAYAQLLIATDSARLFQWAAPTVSLATASLLPVELAPAALALHFLNPWAGDGR